MHAIAGPAGTRDTDFVILTTTTENREQAERIAETLVKERLAGCAQILEGITSYYWWQGRVQRAGELLIIVKTRQIFLGKIEKLFKSLHPYEVPEFVAQPVTGGSESYLMWLSENLPVPE